MTKNSLHRNAVTRRQMVRTVSAGVMGAAVLSPFDSLALANAPDDRYWVDAHSHIWTPDVERFPLANGKAKQDLDPPTFTDAELMKIASLENVRRVVLIQHHIYHGWDNSYLLDAARRHPDRFRVVGMVDDTQPHPDVEMRRLLPLGASGFRITSLIRGKQWLEGPGMAAMWKCAVETRQAMCCLINPQDLPAVDDMCAKFPDAPVVIDHFARIGIDGQFHRDDLDNLCKLARHSHTAVKISAYYALGAKRPPHTELIPMIQRLLDSFGPRRLMWASDSPYQLTPPNTYRDSIALIRDGVDFLKDEDRDWLLRKTAERVFFF